MMTDHPQRPVRDVLRLLPLVGAMMTRHPLRPDRAGHPVAAPRRGDDDGLANLGTLTAMKLLPLVGAMMTCREGFRPVHHLVLRPLVGAMMTGARPGHHGEGCPVAAPRRAMMTRGRDGR